ncbi:GGDEF domain-containing protein [Candidatus Magnetaquicoccus inordinatus]|uniref:GGDEF domain-containing protein n=1 Tax=Candidatus Magnetaquicoccus inordinatus TaxID=2496818 RepID=UPI00187D1C76|nr:GGDEF domain-containing protein [Candidatus Magnetaquicoccus inordinatus]
MERKAGYSTSEDLEQLLDLLNGKPADPIRALAHCEQMLHRPLCAREVQTAALAVAQLIEQMILPALQHDPSLQEVAGRLQEHFQKRAAHAVEDERDPGQVAANRALLEEALALLSAGMPTAIPPTAITDPLPKSLYYRLTTLLRLIGESEESLLRRLQPWHEESVEDWPMLQGLLTQIAQAGHKAATPPWQRRRRQAHETLWRLASELEELLAQMGYRQSERTRLLASMRLADGRLDMARAHSLLHTQAAELFKEAQDLRAQQDAARQRAEQFKQRIDQLEATLAQARREQFLDPTTGIPDRFAFMAHLHRHLDRAVHLGEGFSLLLFHFYELMPLIEQIKQTAPQMPGSLEQRLLLAIIQEMRPHLPDQAFLSRLSTERMVILLPKYDVKSGEQMGSSISQILEEISFELDGREIVLHVNSGCAAFQPGMDVAQMLETTDRLAAAAHSWRAEEQSAPRRVRVC